MYGVIRSEVMKCGRNAKKGRERGGGGGGGGGGVVVWVNNEN